MIDISTWRVRIGVYSGGKRPKKRNRERTTSIGGCNENTRNGLSTILTICAFCFVLNTFSEMKNSHQTLATENFETHVNPFIAYLLIIGGVETNPGPKTEPDSKAMHNLFEMEQSDEESSDSEHELMEVDTNRVKRKRIGKTSDNDEPIAKVPKNSYTVDATTFATNYIEMEINGKTDKPGDYKDIFVRNICALANSEGGVLCIKNTAQCVVFADFDNIILNGKSWLHQIGHSGFGNLVEFKPPTKEQESFMLIFVQGSHLLVTTCMNTYDDHVKYSWKTENMLKVINDILETAPIKYVPKPISVIKDCVEHYQPQPCENKGLEYKGCDKIKNLKSFLNAINVKKDKKGMLIQYICQFSKNANGGSILFGITESGTQTNKTYRVEGIKFLISKEDESNIEDYCRSIIKDNTLWLTYDGKILNSANINEYIRFIFHPMKSVPKNYKVLEIAIACFYGVVFSSSCGPEAWSIDPISNEVKRFKTVDWYRYMRKHLLEDGPILLSKKLSKLTTKRASIKDVHVFQLEDSISQIQKKVFKREVGLSFMPDVLIEKVCEQDSRLIDTMENIRDFYFGETGVVVADRRFLSVLNKNYKDISVCKTCHFCDFFIIGGDKPIVFLSIIALEDSTLHSLCEQKIKKYCHQSAKMVKLILAQYTNIPFAICHGLVDLEHDDVNEALENILQQYQYYPDIFKKTYSSRRRIFEICKSLTLASSIIPSSFQLSIGETFIESLTNEKFAITLNEDQQHFIWKHFDCDGILGVNGFPGTGKTYVAKAFLQKLINQGEHPNSILFFAKEINLCEHIRKLFDVITLTYNELITEHEKDKDFGKHIKHIIVDDAQLIEGVIIKTRDGERLYKWYYILRNIYNSQKKRDRKFIIFFGSHHYKREVKELRELVDFDSIQNFTKIVRNSRSIAEFAAKRMSNVHYQKAVDNIGHTFKGDGVKQKSYRLDSEQDYINAIDNELHDLHAMNVRYGDIAVLFMNIDDIPESINCISIERIRVKKLQYKLELQGKSFKFPKCGKVNICSGAQNDNKTHLVVDSVRGYSSLERPVVIGVGVGKNFKSPNEKLQGLCYTRPLVKLVIIKDINTV